MSIELNERTNILKPSVKLKKNGQIYLRFLYGKNMLENSRKKLEKKNCDMIVAKFKHGRNFGGNTNIVTLTTKYDEVSRLK